MADHKAEQVMVAVGTALAGVTVVAGRIERSRTFSIEGSNGVSYEMGADEPTDGEAGYQVMDCLLEVRVTAHSRSTNPEIELNEIKKQIIIALKADYTLGGAARDITEQGWTEPDTSGESEKPTTQSTGTFSVVYRRSRTDPSVTV